MKYKVGDKVRIKSLDWYNENKDEDGYVDGGRFFFDKEMTKFCDKVLKIVSVLKESYYMDDGYCNIDWTDEMIEELVEEETYDFLKTDKPYPSPEDRLDNIQFVIDNELKLPEGYIFKDENGNIINATKIVLEKKKKEYPKTYADCCEVLQYDESLKIYPPSNADVPEYDVLGLFDLLETLRKLLICRDAYWKIAGEEMGLGKPWKPDWTNNNEVKFIIGVSENEIIKCYNGIAQYILAFPTEEMQDAFYENFKKEIESCKELL